MDFCLLYFYGPEHLWTSCIHCSNNFKPFKISSNGTHHWGEVVTICRVKSYLRHLPMTPQNSNNLKEAGERNKLIALLLCFALTSQVLIEWLMLYFGSHCLSEGASFCHTGQFYRFQSKIRLFRQLLVPGQSRSWKEGTPFRCFNRNAQCGWGKTWQGGSRHCISLCQRWRSGKCPSTKSKLRNHDNSNPAHHPRRTSYLSKI